LLRGLLFIGNRFRCNCCGWRLRGFVGPRGFLRTNDDGYCPRCNSKARHRRNLSYLTERTAIFDRPTRLLEVGPWWSLSRKLMASPTIDYVGLDLERTGAHVNLLGDVVEIPAESESFDAVLCIHVLEHIEDDRRAIAELFRVLRPGGIAIINVPLNLELPTVEDPTIKDPFMRKALFGEVGHVRYYGLDIRDRLTEAGFDVALDLGDKMPAEERRRYGMRDNEHIFHCRKSALRHGNSRESDQTVATRPADILTESDTAC